VKKLSPQTKFVLLTAGYILSWFSSNNLGDNFTAVNNKCNGDDTKSPRSAHVTPNCIRKKNRSQANKQTNIQTDKQKDNAIAYSPKFTSRA